MTARTAARTALILAAIAASALSAISLLAVAEADVSAVTVRSSSISSEFPTGFRIRVSVTSQREIQSAAIRLRFGRQTRTGYDYLETTKHGSTLDGELLWRTNTADSYIPPGTAVTYNFEFTDASGSRHETETAQFIYHDPRFVWKEISEGPVTVAYHGRSERRPRDILDAMLLTLDRMAPLLGADPHEPIRVTVYDSWNEMRSAIPPSSATYRSHLITQGQAFSNVGVLLVLGSRSAAGTASHEMTHVIVHRAGEGPARKVPPWLHEGLAEYGNVDPGSSYENALRRGIRQDRLLPVTHMGSLPGRPNDVLLFYGQSKALVRMLIDDFGPDKMRDFMALYKSGESMDDALLKTYRLDRVALENRWRDSIGASPLSPAYSNDDRPTPVPPPTILPYTLKPDAEGQFVGNSDAQHTSAPPPQPSPPTTSERPPSDTPVPLVYGAPSSATGSPAHDEPPQSPAPAGSGCGLSPTNAPLDLTTGAALLGLALLSVAAHRRAFAPLQNNPQYRRRRFQTCPIPTHRPLVLPPPSP